MSRARCEPAVILVRCSIVPSKRSYQLQSGADNLASESCASGTRLSNLVAARKVSEPSRDFDRWPEPVCAVRCEMKTPMNLTSRWMDTRLPLLYHARAHQFPQYSYLHSANCHHLSPGQDKFALTWPVQAKAGEALQRTFVDSS